MAEDIVVFKGSKDGLHLIIQTECSLETLKDSIHKKISSAQTFFQGIRKIKYKGTSLSKDELDILTHWFMEHFEIELEREKIEDPSRIDDEACSVLPSKVIEEGLTKFVYSTIRSGMKIQYNGTLSSLEM